MADLWEVVGGAETGGIIVRKGCDVKSEAEAERLGTGAIIECLGLQGERLRYRKLQGVGPETGWVTVKLKTKDLVVKTTRQAHEQPAKIGGAADIEADSSNTLQSDDIFAALDALDKPQGEQHSHARSAAESGAHAQLFDLLFGHDDADEKELTAMLHQIVSGIGDRGVAHFLLWRRALPLLFDAGERGRHANLLRLLCDSQCGFLEPGSDRAMNEVACDTPTQEEPSGVVVFLMGWGGGTVPDMDDAVAFYRGMYPGAVIVRLTCAAKGSFGLRCECAYGIRAASHAWARAAQSCKPKLLVHLFSNGGFNTWAEMLRCWRAVGESHKQHPSLAGPLPPMADVLRGVLLDSACNAEVPIEACIQSHLQSMAAAVGLTVASDHDGSEAGKRAAERNGKKAVLVLLGDQSPAKAQLANKPKDFLQGMSNADVSAVHELEPPVELQFIYSRDDTIIAFPGIEEYINAVIARSSRLKFPTPQSLVFEKSKHVAHKVLHRDAYWKCVERFSSSVLVKSQP
mmetsp:Transcript_18596/g.53271  ORF Transcript_18596/g.53271 Transcript_18596/m.53271 type:complete len:515 (-) Transcript_18596:85-1629(-)